ncbi:MAG: acyltransferase family protein [Sedimentisphaerales bacterium]
MANNSEQQEVIKGRVVSIDALRGFDMFWIIGGGKMFQALIEAANSKFLNNLQPQLNHAQWEGFRSWDLIMPLFLFIVGVAMPFSFNKRLQRGDSKRQLYFHIIKRTIILFILGMIAGGHLLAYDLSKLRIYCNTLQAIAAGYLIASIIMLNMRVVWQITITAALLLLFWALMMLVPVPGYGGVVLQREANLALYVDKLIMGRFYGGNGYTWILSSITFGCTVMMGVLAGQLLRCQKRPAVKVALLLAIGAGCLLMGLLWHNWFPIIKRIWSSSFVLFSAGLCYLLLALFYLVIDMWGLRRWAFGFVVIGMNAIAVYMSTHLFNFRHVGNIFVGNLDKWLGPWNDFVQATAAFAVIWLILYWMYRKKSFIKI